MYLGTNRVSQQQRRQIVTDVAAHALVAEQQMIAEQKAAAREAARKEAAAKAAAEAKLAAERAKRANQEASRRRTERTESTPSFGPIPGSCGEYDGNRAIGCALLLDYGFKLDQMPCLDKLWTRESGWNHKAYNESSGAYGIPQALPGSKMATVADDWQTNPATQIKWGLGYIEGRYDDPCGAWQHSESTGWY